MDGQTLSPVNMSPGLSPGLDGKICTHHQQYYSKQARLVQLHVVIGKVENLAVFCWVAMDEE